MKLQGVFMIIPLLAVVVSGKTIHNADDRNAQQRGNRGPDNNEPGDEDPMDRFAVGSDEDNEDDQYQVAGQNPGGAEYSWELDGPRRQQGSTGDKNKKKKPSKSPGSGCGFLYLFTCKKS
ncbi:hypothetical protein BASA50_004083 [Batrachochytrium salamandrivorans]|uniref:Uncharacterized protein n=1 Tax=Batrachochytrium salamandrivorans TaxID=1357716 RepID=A0ABQ8FGI1_9FUNG|nr:hypothetical protein BASA50_004083 [Batrachochytrium salamandrivorans]KAH6601986.1 hypothetical protein BASA61_001563 [Batrachochytrium salamandrivorans]